MNGARVLDGRLPRGQHELAITALAEERLHIHVGDTLRSASLRSRRRWGAAEHGRRRRRWTALFAGAGAEPFTVVGVVAMQGGFAPVPAASRRSCCCRRITRAPIPTQARSSAVRLRRGRAGIAAFERELDRRARAAQVAVADKNELASAVERSLDVQAAALRILAASSRRSRLLLLGQALARQARVGVASTTTCWRRSGPRAAQLGVFGLVRGVGGRARWPGSRRLWSRSHALAAHADRVARQAELHPGVEVNMAYIGVGALAVVAADARVGAGLAWWTARVGADGSGGRDPSLRRAALAGGGFRRRPCRDCAWRSSPAGGGPRCRCSRRSWARCWEWRPSRPC